ncbi:MAG: hypothetical protein C7N36_15750 [Bacteroidetes bacterium]|nr:MAG: hypothetical protein C7N36_15750 [Bacteroidota bacterium]
MKYKRVFLDTSFLIRLLDASDPDFQNANTYFRRMLKEGTDFLLSTIVVAEYGVGSDIANLPIRQLRLLPFNFSHARLTANFAQSAFIGRRKGALEVGSRVVIPNDTKLLAQAAVEGVDLFIGRDDNCESVWRFLKDNNELQFLYLDLRTPPEAFFGELFSE